MGKIIYWIVFIILIIIAGLTAISAVNIPYGYKLLTVQSGSMEPKIKTGSIVIVLGQKDYQKGDIISFKDLAQPKQYVTHRIFEVKEKDNKVFFTTKGDANDSPDGAEVGKENVLGKVIFSIPFLGYIVNFVKTLPGLIFLVIVPTVVIVYNEILNIKKEALRLLKEKKKRKLNLKEKIEEKVGEEIIEAEKEIKKII